MIDILILINQRLKLNKTKTYQMHIRTFPIFFNRNNIQSHRDNQMRNQLIYLNQNQHTLTNKHIRCYYMHTIVFTTDEIIVPVEIETQY